MEEKMSLKRLEQLFISSVHVCKYVMDPGVVKRRNWERYAICRVVTGKGILMIDDAVHTAAPGDWFLLKPEMRVEFRTYSEEPARYEIILFSCVELTRSQNNWFVRQPEFTLTGKLNLSSDLPEFDERMQTLTTERVTSLGKGMDNNRRKHLLHQLLIRLMASVKQESPPVTGMEQAIEYMTRHYMNEIRLDHMSRMAGLSVNHFIRTFKLQFNMTPMEYVLKQRMSKAKQLLFSSDKIRDIGEQVGYRDEHYFSRIFKKSEGVAPTMYMKKRVNRIATLYYGLDDYIVTLGLKPVTILSYNQRVLRHTRVPELDTNVPEDIQLDRLTGNYDRLRQVKPDLILTSDRCAPDEALHHIAPTAMIKHTNEVGERLVEMADILGRAEQAERWREQHADLRQLLHRKIQSRWGPRSAMFIRITAAFYRMYGKTNQTGALLYNDLPFHLPEGFPMKKWVMEADLDRLELYQADHIFVMIDPTAEASTRWRQLQQSERWLALDAVKEGRVYDAGDMFFKTLGPAGRMWAMRYVANQVGISVR